MQNKPVISYGARSAPSARRLRNDTNPLAVRGQYNVYFRPPDSFHGTTLTAMVGAPSSTASRPALSEPLGGLSKRLLDLAIAVPLLIVLLPVMIVIAILISVFSGGTPIFSHLRVGHGGQLFPCYKFRTMVPDAEVRLNQYIASNPAAAREWAERRKLRHDPRVTRLGKLLRKSSLDELPQLFNVVLGDMSCVGPRPVTEEEVDRYGGSAGYYLSTRPGITGLWQVSGRSATDFATRVMIDEHYVSNWGLIGDIVILLKTPLAVLRSAEAH